MMKAKLIFMTVLAIIILIFVILAIFTGTIAYYLGNLRNQFRRKIGDLYPTAQFIIEGRSFGQQSHGMGQVRGTGTLALTSDTLHFQLWIPNRVLDIPLTSITNIDNPRSFLGKATAAKLLKVEFTNEQGQSDAIAWQIRDLEDIQRQIEQAIQSVR